MKNKKVKAIQNHRIYSKKDLKHSGIARHCECMHITPKVLSEMTDIPQQRIEDAVSAKISLGTLELGKISIALGCRLDGLYDDRLSALDEKMAILEKDITQMKAAYDYAVDDAIDKIVDDPEILNSVKDDVRDYIDAIEDADTTSVLLIPHSLVSKIESEEDLEKYFVSSLLKVCADPCQNEDVDQGILVIDERDFDVAVGAIKVAFLVVVMSDDCPMADVSVYVFNASENRFTKEVVVFDGAEERSYEDPNAKIILNAHAKAFRESLEVIKMQDLFPELFKK